MSEPQSTSRPPVNQARMFLVMIPLFGAFVAIEELLPAQLGRPLARGLALCVLVSGMYFAQPYIRPGTPAKPLAARLGMSLFYGVLGGALVYVAAKYWGW